MSPQSEDARPAVAEASEYSAEERRALLRLAHRSIEAALEGSELDLTPPGDHLAEYRGAFTTLHLDGKLRGTAQIYQACCRALGVAEQVSLADLLPAPWLSELSIDSSADPTWALASICRAVYDPRRDDADFRRSLVGDADARKAAFDRLRKHYPMRREIDGLRVRIQGDSAPLAALVRALGATVS